jgi:DNA-directed RNA polymerase subunit RPC12/RpoP
MKQKCKICKKEFELPNEKKESYPRDPKTTGSAEIKYICPECSKLTSSM